MPPAVEGRSLNHWIARKVPKVSYFKVDTSVALSPLTVLYSHHLYVVPEHFHHPQKDMLSPLAVIPHSPSPSPWHNHEPAFCLYGFACSEHFL